MSPRRKTLEGSKAVRLSVETARLIKVASARAGETVQGWVEVACRQRLEREVVVAADRQRTVSVEFEDRG